MLSITGIPVIRRARIYCKQHHDALVVFLGVVAALVLAFEAGVIQGAARIQPPLRIELAPDVATMHESQMPESYAEAAGASPKRAAASLGTAPLSTEGDCAFVASRNSKLYHAASCAVVKRIKSSNRLCFRSAAEAEQQGLQQGCRQ